MSGYCRVTVSGPQRWADLALPSTVSVAALMPQVVRVCSPDPEGTEAARWTLARVDGAPVGADVSLESAGVMDGDVLLLRRESAPDRPAFVDDVRGAVEDRVDETAWMWKPSTTLGLGLVLAAFTPLLLTLLMSALRQTPLDVLVGVLGLLFSLGAVRSAARRSMTGAAHALLAASCGWGALTAALAALLWVGPGSAPVVVVLFACAGALAAAAGGWWAHDSALAYLAAFGVVTASAGLLVGVGLFVDGPLAVRVLAVLLVLAVGALPRTALAMGGLSGLDYEVRQVGRTGTGRFEDGLAHSDRLLLGALLGVVAAATAMALLLVFTGEGLRDLVLAALVSLALVMRSRLFDRVSHALPLRLAGVLGLVAAAFAAASTAEWAAALLPAAVLVAFALVGIVSGVRLTEVPRASLRRLLNGVEVVVVVALCVAAVWASGVYELVTSISIGG